MITNTNAWHLPVRKVLVGVELYKGSTSTDFFTSNDRVKSLRIERVGEENKFFGFGICQKLNLHLIDTKRQLNITTEHSFILAFRSDGNDLYPYPTFYVTEVHRDEVTNELSITAYDKLYAAAARTYSELKTADIFNKDYMIGDLAYMCNVFLGLSGMSIFGLPSGHDPFETYYPDGANFEGTETIREVLDAIAEATQTIYYINNNDTLIFKRPDKDGEPVLTIGKANYFNLDSKTNRRLSDICSATELGDNVITNSGIIGTTQYVRDNPFWELREDIRDLLSIALLYIAGLTINQFECHWRGNPALEIGDKIALVTKDDNIVISYVFNDVIEYNGVLTQTTRWAYTDEDIESLDNPLTLGDALKKTYAKVDKANQQIGIVAGETAALKLTANTIQASVSQLDDNMADVIAEVSTKMSANDVSISIQTALEQGVERVTTTTGFTFNEEGMHISKTGSEITTTITEDGMTVLRENDEVLVADNLGVKAEDLHATTFLIIGNNSRFEDYDGNRTGCFWVG